jgi:hypothetical protein
LGLPGRQSGIAGNRGCSAPGVHTDCWPAWHRTRLFVLGAHAWLIGAALLAT